MKLKIALLAAAILGLAANANAKSFEFGKHAKFTNISFESKMEVEDILGTTHTAKGEATWDKGKGSFSFQVPVASLRTGIAMRDEHLRSPMWLDAAKFATISFSGKAVKKVGKGKYKVSGSFTLHGKSRAVVVVVEVKQIPAKLAKSVGLGDADWIRVRGSFKLKLSDFGVTIPKMAAAKVNDNWTVKVSLFGKAR